MARVYVYPAGTVVTVAPVRELSDWEAARPAQIAKIEPELHYVIDPSGQKIYYPKGSPSLTLQPLSWTDINGMIRSVALCLQDGRIGWVGFDRLRFINGPGRRA